MTGPLVVVGDSLLDVDTTGVATRLCPDAPVPVLEDAVEVARPGGAALAALLAARDGSEVVLVTGLADDEDGDRLAALLAEESRIRVVGLPLAGPTPVKHRIRAGDRPLVRVDRGGPATPLPDLDPDVVERVGAALAGAGSVLVCDYGRGVTADASIRAALRRNAARAPMVWDPHPRGSRPVRGARLVCPNATEAAGFAGQGDGAGSGLAVTARHADLLVGLWEAVSVAVTLGPGGALLSYGTGAPVVVPAPAAAPGDTCGAGDRFAVTAAIELGQGAVTTEAVHRAVSAASRYVAVGGPASLTRRPPVEPEAAASTAHTGSAVTGLVARTRARGGTVVATGGCFDLLHAGHVATLRAARSLGDVLVVCVNSDASVRRLKGPGRPVVSAADRCRVLQALEPVDAVVVFDEDTPDRVLRELRPDVWAKGGDYTAEALPESATLAQWGGQVVVLPYLPGRSTTRMLFSQKEPV